MLREKSTELPVNSLVLSEIRKIWAEFDDFEIEMKMCPVFLAVLLMVSLTQNSDCSSTRQVHGLRGGLLAQPVQYSDDHNDG